jgi:hypothetical protein
MDAPHAFFVEVAISLTKTLRETKSTWVEPPLKNLQS